MLLLLWGELPVPQQSIEPHAYTPSCLLIVVQTLQLVPVLLAHHLPTRLQHPRGHQSLSAQEAALELFCLCQWQVAPSKLVLAGFLRARSSFGNEVAACYPRPQTYREPTVTNTHSYKRIQHLSVQLLWNGTPAFTFVERKNFPFPFATFCTWHARQKHCLELQCLPPAPQLCIPHFFICPYFFSTKEQKEFCTFLGCGIKVLIEKWLPL